jgi:hypothetical protein
MQRAFYEIYHSITTCCRVIACAAHPLCLSYLVWWIVVWSLHKIIGRRSNSDKKPVVVAVLAESIEQLSIILK